MIFDDDDDDDGDDGDGANIKGGQDVNCNDARWAFLKIAEPSPAALQLHTTSPIE